MRLANSFGAANLLRRERPLTSDELAYFVPSVFTIRAAHVQGVQRLHFRPQYFGKIPQCILLEPRIFSWMDRLCEAYSVGIRDFHTLSNVGAFIAPYSDISWSV